MSRYREYEEGLLECSWVAFEVVCLIVRGWNGMMNMDIPRSLSNFNASIMKIVS